MRFWVHTYTNQGGRDRNEDSVVCHTGDECCIITLADGLGGHCYGEVASALATQVITDTLREYCEREPLSPKSLKDAFQKANETIIAKRSELGNAVMKTTAVALAVCGEDALWGHIGDSRLYRFSDNELVFQTKDHSVTYKKFLGGEITKAQIRGDEDRAALLKVLGNSEKCEPEILETTCKLRDQDAFLLCSDGFWEYVTETEMLADLLKADSPKDWVDHMLIRHIKRADRLNDNLSVAVLWVDDIR